MDTSRRFRSLTPIERRAVVEALAGLWLAWVGLRLLRLPALTALCDRLGPGPSFSSNRTSRADEKDDADTVGLVAWGVRAAGSRIPFLGGCLVSGLAVHAMLRRRGLRSQMRVGVRDPRQEPAGFAAHAWVECSGAVAFGGLTDLGEYSVLFSTGPRTP
jgi:hypothetical protein